jgi:PAS domain S-box-containing protein
VGARITLDEIECATPNYRPTAWRQFSPIEVDGKAVGMVEVVALSPESPGARLFLHEEQQLLDAIADRIAEFRKRRSAERAVACSEAFYRSLIENARELTSILATDGTNQFMSPATEHVLGYSAEERLGRSGFELVHPDDMAHVQQAFAEVLAGTRGNRMVEFRLRAKNGAWRWFESTGTNRLHDPAVRGIVINSRDVTDRRKAEERIGFQAHLLDAVGQAVVATDAADRVIYMNREAELLYGRTLAEAAGGAISALIGTEPRLRSTGIQTVREDGTWSGEFVVRRRNGSTFPAYGTESPLLDDRGNVVGIVTVAVDMTERKQSEQRLRENEERLQQSRKLEAIGQLAGGIAHDFNNLLTGIHGFAQLALDTLPENSEARLDLEEVQRSANRAAALTRQLLAFSRKQVLQSRVIDLNKVVRETHRMLQRLIGEDIRVVTRLEEGVCCVNADPGQLEQVILNLAVNARDAMPTGGDLVIETANASIDEAEAARHSFDVRPGQYVLLAMRDTGMGMDAATVARVFEPFFTTKELGQGTGLGLSTVYGIIKQSGGYIWVDSTPGKGTTMRAYLPRTEETPVHAEGEIRSRPERGTETVLLVEDDDTVRALTRRILRRQGYHVLEARNGIEALRIAEPGNQVIDLVLSDVVMPELGGRQLVERLRRIRPELPVLLMSGYTDDAIVRHGIIGAGEMFLEKPFTTDALAHKVRLALDRTRN